MVKIMENPIEMHDFGGTPIFGNTHIVDGWNFTPTDKEQGAYPVYLSRGLYAGGGKPDWTTINGYGDDPWFEFWLWGITP